MPSPGRRRFYCKLKWTVAFLICRVTIENDTYDNATVVKVYSANRHGILLNVVQVLTDLDLSIIKSDIFSDGDWFMDGELLCH